MKKNERIAAYVVELAGAGTARHPAPYLGFFLCFNRGEYYEAHDILEHLWLGETGPDARFYQGLIQLAGAYVHLQKHYHSPTHPVHRRRLRPAARLFALAMRNLEPFGPRHMDLDVAAVIALCQHETNLLQQGKFESNPWSPQAMPQLALD